MIHTVVIDDEDESTISAPDLDTAVRMAHDKTLDEEGDLMCPTPPDRITSCPHHWEWARGGPSHYHYILNTCSRCGAYAISNQFSGRLDDEVTRTIYHDEASVLQAWDLCVQRWDHIYTGPET